MSSTDNNTYKGQLKRWNDSKGFGFIGAEDEDRDIFIHISELKQMTRRPTIGDVITYQIQVQDDGKNRAYNAHIEGVDVFKSKGQKNSMLSLKNKWVITFIIIAIIAVTYFVAT
ncbi:cold shock domain-containing protein [Thiomicrorhabdus arctica]|uniref:cold shock domain-containing protein n=1 Tax=Thiomicrorhabdus arctica TaxID=131540 RepID=UPI0003666B4E|nr:cold shock domain-containing protein [Thiomicrorhabdus arctica]